MLDARLHDYRHAKNNASCSPLLSVPTSVQAVRGKCDCSCVWRGSCVPMYVTTKRAFERTLASILFLSDATRRALFVSMLPVCKAHRPFVVICRAAVLQFEWSVILAIFELCKAITIVIFRCHLLPVSTAMQIMQSTTLPKSTFGCPSHRCLKATASTSSRSHRRGIFGL